MLNCTLEGNVLKLYEDAPLIAEPEFKKLTEGLLVLPESTVYVELAELATGKVTRLGEVVNELTSLSPDRSRAVVAYEKDDQVWMSLIDEEQGIVDKQRLR